jgi:hypothetical protein
MPSDSFGKLLIVLGLSIAVIGAIMLMGNRLPFLGNLPGDLSFERDNVKVYIPIATSILLSIILTVVLNVVFGIFGRR